MSHETESDDAPPGRVMVDSTVWSLAFRRRDEDLSPTERAKKLHLLDLVYPDRAILPGPVRQEVLTGLRVRRRFEQVRNPLRQVPDEPTGCEDFEEAADCQNRCEAAGIAGSPVDFLLCAAAVRRDVPIFTGDLDFRRYANVLPIRLYEEP